jgi:oxygen-dependent protoporphyrinogen oxidase
MVRDVAVIGAGPAGLAAAWGLVSAGASVTLYERGTTPGGLLRTDTLEGVRIDVAVQLLGSYYRETLRLAAEVGKADLLMRAPGRDALWRGGRAHGVSYGSVASLAGSSALPAGLKFRLASRYLAFLRRHAGILDPAAPVRALSLDSESIAAWGRRELGADFVELLAYPQLASYYGLTPEATSAGFYHGLARAGLSLQLYAVRGGMGEFAAAVAGGLEGRGARLLTGVEICAVHEAPDGVRVEWSNGEARHEAAVLAVPAPTALALTGLPTPLREWLGGVRYAEEAVVALAFEHALPVDYFGLSFPRGEPPGDRVAAFCVQAGKGVALGDEGGGGLVVVPAPPVMAEAVAATPREALDLVLPAVERVYPQLRGRITRAKVYRFPDGRVLFYPGYLSHLVKFDPDWLSPRLILAGDYLIAPTVEGAVRSGREAAARLLRTAP